LCCFFAASHFGRIQATELHPLAGQSGQLALVSFMFLIATSFFYLALQNILTQYITKSGILFFIWQKEKFTFKPVLLPWSQIRDYYIKSDYPVTFYNFLYQNATSLTIHRITLKVPFYALPKFENLLSVYLQEAEQYRQTTKGIFRNISQN
jgi:hypothetical protein